MTSYRFGFLTTLGVNVGDEFIREGVRSILDGLEVAYGPLYVNKHDPTSLVVSHEDEIETVSDKFWESDLFVQSGAPVYWHLHRGESRSVDSEWHEWMWRERILGRSDGAGPLFVNLGAGSCQPWGDDASAFLEDAECARFARDAGSCATLTTVRDPLAGRILDALGVEHETAVCPAFLAGCRHSPSSPVPDLIGVNLMELAGHYDVTGDFDRDAWSRKCQSLLKGLRGLGRLVFVCHDHHEARFASTLVAADERIFLSSAWRDYLDIYSACTLVVANRVHGAVCAAGFGVPGVVIGNDTRAEIVDFLGLPRFRADNAPVDAIVEAASGLFVDARNERERLLAERGRAVEQYRVLFRPTIEQLRSRPPGARAPKDLPAAARAHADVVPLLDLEISGQRLQKLNATEPVFDGWSECRGLRDEEGPYPEWQLPRVRWGLAPVTTLIVDSRHARPVHLMMRCQPRVVESQVVTVKLNGVELDRYQFEQSDRFVDLVWTLSLASGANEIDLEYAANNPNPDDASLAMLYALLKLTPVEARWNSL